MVAYSFQARFEAAIVADNKLQTVRADRKRHARPGEELQLYAGMRTRHCRLLGRRRCLAIDPIVIGVASELILVGEEYPMPALGMAVEWLMPEENRVWLKRVDLDAFASADGFAAWRSMKLFWADAHAQASDPDLYFTGVVIRWLPMGAVTEEAAGLDAELDAIGVR